MNPKRFVQEFKKSIDYPNSKTIIDSKDQEAAERSVPQTILTKLSDANDKSEGEVSNYQFQKGTLTLAKKDQNLFSGFFTDEAGQIVEKFDAHTVELVAKTLMVKGYFTDLDIEGESADLKPEPAVPSTVEVATPYVPQTLAVIKVGDLEITLKKSIRDFVNDFRKDRNSALLQKAISSWRRSQKFTQFESNTDAAKELLANWDTHKESFNQTMFAIRQLEKSR